MLKKEICLLTTYYSKYFLECSNSCCRHAHHQSQRCIKFVCDLDKCCQALANPFQQQSNF